MKKWTLGLLSSVLFGSLFLAGCGNSGDTTASSSSSQAAKEEISVGHFPNLDHAPAIVGLRKNIFAENLEGVSIRPQVFPDGNAFMDALNSGNLDIGYVGPGPAINRFIQGNDVVILASAANGATLVVARADSGITTVSDLDGKKSVHQASAAPIMSS